MSAEPVPPIDFDRGFRVGDFAVYPLRLELVRDGKTTHLERKVMDVLVLLARHANEVVEHDRFFEPGGPWPRPVSPEVLPRAISLLRDALGDDTKAPSYIVTIPKRGYRLIAPVRPLEEKKIPSPGDATPPPPPPEPPKDRRRWIALAALVAVIAVAAVYAIIRVLPHPPQEMSIAVMTFDSPPTDDFGEGQAEEIVRMLITIDHIRVVAKPVRDTTDDAREVGKRFGVDWLIQGSVRRDRDRLRVTIELVDAKTGMLERSQTFDRQVADIFEVQHEIAEAIRGWIVPGAPSAQLAKAPTADVDAYLLFMRANQLLRERGAQRVNHAIDLYKQAIARDPKFGRAYAGLAEAYTLQPSYSGGSERAAHQLALEAADRAVALGADDAHLEGVRAYVHTRLREWDAAQRAFERALLDGPDDADVLQWHSQFLACVGKLAKAGEAAKAAVKADPLSPAANQRAGVISLWTDQRDDAAKYFSAANEDGIQGAGLPEAWIAFLLSQQRFDEARSSALEAQTIRGQATDWIDPTFAALEHRGPPQAAIDVAGGAYHAGKLGAPMYVGAMFEIGDADGFYGAIRDVIASGEPFDVEVFFGAAATTLRSDPRFLPTMASLHLVEFWNAAGMPDACTGSGDAISCR